MQPECWQVKRLDRLRRVQCSQNLSDLADVFRISRLLRLSSSNNCRRPLCLKLSIIVGRSFAMDVKSHFTYVKQHLTWYSNPRGGGNIVAKRRWA